MGGGGGHLLNMGLRGGGGLPNTRTWFDNI